MEVTSTITKLWGGGGSHEDGADLDFLAPGNNWFLDPVFLSSFEISRIHCQRGKRLSSRNGLVPAKVSKPKQQK